MSLRKYQYLQFKFRKNNFDIFWFAYYIIKVVIFLKWMSTFILTLIGVSIASRKVRGGIGMHIGLGIGISFTFIMFMQVSTTFAVGGQISPLVAVWIPNFIFAILAFYLLKIAQK